MKYFTFRWWADGSDGDPYEVFRNYQRSVELVFDQLPADLQRLIRQVDLHDSRLRRMQFTGNQLEIHLDGCGYDQESKSYFDRRIHLVYRGVTSFLSTADPAQGLSGPHGYGDLGYNEIELVEARRFEHRMLFSTGIELEIQFEEFQLSYEDFDD